ncbi:acetylxylan esterase [Paenibacillus sp. Soil522]|uniref:acetylxylan esterase n=1 Tax=Paenibacillus sp. Soil522 TaxID=1736388 RepID=UPI0006FD1758|nr:acetylxylan esterase [Paenibacillus sp. Soil522]KRE32529.1 cephalosporin deacetylase [Paenibacillus sp. Soil522]
MAQPYDLPLDQLREYKPALTRRDDFDAFWNATIAELAKVPLTYERTELSYPVKGLKVYSVFYQGFNDARIEAILALPEQADPLPGIVAFHGYNWCVDGDIHDTVNQALKGYAVLKMFCRGQHGESQDNVVSSNGHVAGWMAKGIQNKDEYYYRAVYMDAVRAIDILAAMPEVNADRIAVTGGSQGGAITLAAAALSGVPKLAVADHPYLSNFERAIDTTPRGPYSELNDYFRRHSGSPAIETNAKETLSYFDIMNLAPRISCYSWLTIGLVDDITPPSTVFAVYNHITCDKDIAVYRYFGHELVPGSIAPRLQLFMDYLQIPAI